MTSNRNLTALKAKLNKLVAQRQTATRSLRIQEEKIQNLQWQIEQIEREINDITGGTYY